MPRISSFRIGGYCAVSAALLWMVAGMVTAQPGPPGPPPMPSMPPMGGGMGPPMGGGMGPPMGMMRGGGGLPPGPQGGFGPGQAMAEASCRPDHSAEAAITEFHPAAPPSRRACRRSRPLAKPPPVRGPANCLAQSGSVPRGSPWSAVGRPPNPAGGKRHAGGCRTISRRGRSRANSRWPGNWPGRQRKHRELQREHCQQQHRLQPEQWKHQQKRR